MTGLPVQDVAQVAMERILNALPEGFLVAFFAWALLRVLPRQNSGTRFAVWFLALLTVAALPVLGSFGEGRILLVAGMSSLKSSGSSWGSMRPAITIPARWGLFAFLGWALGAGAAMLPLVAGLCRLRQLRRSCAEIDPADLDPLVRRTVDAIGRSGRVTVTTSECVRVPAAIGFFKRTIVLPAWVLRELPPSDLNVILLHEFAHLRRWDDWTNLIQKIVRALFFFHPAVWWIENRLSMEREMACDDAVLAETANPRGYATCLVSLLEKSLAHRLAHRMSHPRWSMAQAAVHRAREAALRLARILDTNRPVATRVWKPALAMVGAFSVICRTPRRWSRSTAARWPVIRFLRTRLQSANLCLLEGRAHLPGWTRNTPVAALHVQSLLPDASLLMPRQRTPDGTRHRRARECLRQA
jgi:beta-lactamase regulating signal transducer with metallopeptidase domain